jgi:hypothetical protein
VRAGLLHRQWDLLRNLCLELQGGTSQKSRC